MDKGNAAPVVPRASIAIFAMLVSCFALWGLLNNMTDNLVPAFQRIFTMDQSRAGLVQVAFYGAYAVLAIFAAVLAEEFSYRKGVLIGLAIYIAGALLYIPACIAQSFDIYFVAIFIVAGGCSLLETTCNPYVLSLGDQETAVRRLNFAQMFNPVGSMCGIVLAKQLILSHLNPATAEERAQMAPEVLRGVIDKELFWVCAPYVGLCAIALLIWLFFFLRREGETASPRSAFARAGAALAFSVVPMTVLYFVFPEMDKVKWVLCGVCGPVAYVLVSGGYRSMLAVLARTPRLLHDRHHALHRLPLGRDLRDEVRQPGGHDGGVRGGRGRVLRRSHVPSDEDTVHGGLAPVLRKRPVPCCDVRLHVAHVPDDLRHCARRTRPAGGQARGLRTHHGDSRRGDNHPVDGVDNRQPRLLGEPRPDVRLRGRPEPPRLLGVAARVVRRPRHLLRRRIRLRGRIPPRQAVSPDFLV